MLPNNTLPPETRKILKDIPSLIDKTFPMPGRFRGVLPSQIAELSRLLTNKRGDRRLSYLGQPNYLSAYLRYFLPWNLYRLCIILHSMDITLSPGDTITDLGSGPLTFASALWIARPDLRSIPLEINCIDHCAPVLEAGKKFFAAIAGENPWKINIVRDSIDVRRTDVTRNKKQAAMVCAVNIFNEIYEKLPHNNTDGLKRIAADAALLMHNEASADACILTMEPGVPQSGKFISFLRAAFMELERPPVSPCTHATACPLSGGKKRWCHFAFETADAPKELNHLSAAAGIPKERLVLSYLLTGAVSKNPRSGAETSREKTREARIISDAFPLPRNRFGRYGCCANGLVLLAGEKERINEIGSGSLFTPVFTAGTSARHEGERDAKSGALILEVK
jgi:ribosomal protein RSM22 (predicted rRNA methylase)